MLEQFICIYRIDKRWGDEMNKILYEASYIGSPKIFFDQVFTILLFIFGIGLSVHKLRKMKDTEEINLRYKINCILAYIVIVVFGIVGLCRQ